MHVMVLRRGGSWQASCVVLPSHWFASWRAARHSASQHRQLHLLRLQIVAPNDGFAAGKALAQLPAA